MKPQDWYLELPDRSEIWLPPRQHCCRCTCQISKRCDNSNYQSRGFETPRDFTTRRLYRILKRGPDYHTVCGFLWDSRELNECATFLGREFHSLVLISWQTAYDDRDVNYLYPWLRNMYRKVNWNWLTLFCFLASCVCILINNWLYKGHFQIPCAVRCGSVSLVGILLGQHYDDVIMSAMASQINSLTIVYQSSASLAFVRGIHRWPTNSPHKGPVTRKMFPFDAVIMVLYIGWTVFWLDRWPHYGGDWIIIYGISRDDTNNVPGLDDLTTELGYSCAALLFEP